MNNKIALNIKYSILSQIIKIILLFINRKVFIYFLGVEFLGVNSLFISLLSILSMTELGIGSAVAFSLYKPIAENDERKIIGIMCLYKRAYHVIGIIVFIAGCFLIPFIPSIVNTTENIPFLRLMFFIVLLKTSLTYMLFAYSQTLLIAAEYKYEVDQITMVFYIITNIVEIITLIITRNYVAFLLIDMLCLLLQQYIIYKRSIKKFPNLINTKWIELEKEDKREIWKNVYGLSVNKFAGAVLGAIDNVILSTFISTTIVGIYSNYIMILAAATGIMSMGFGSVTANLGRKFVDKTLSEQHFFSMFYINFLLCGICSISYYILINDFISIVFGSNLVLNATTVFAITFNMVISYLSLSVQVFKNVSGIFWYGKYRPIITCIINICFSLLFVKPFGITGVIFATALSRLVTTIWYDPYLLFKYTFNKKPIRYFSYYFFYCIIIFISVAIITFITNLQFFPTYIIINFIIKTIVTITLSSLFLILGTLWMKEPFQILAIMRNKRND